MCFIVRRSRVDRACTSSVCQEPVHWRAVPLSKFPEAEWRQQRATRDSSAEPLAQSASALQASSAAKSGQPQCFRPLTLPLLFLSRPSSPLSLPSSLLRACSLHRIASFVLCK